MLPPILYPMQVTLLVVGLIVGFALGLGVGWYFWRPAHEEEEEELERSERRPARYPRSYEPSTPPQHRPTPRPRPVTALHHPNPLLTNVDAPRPEPASAHLSDRTLPPVSVPPPEPEPARSHEYRPAPAPEPAGRFEYRPAPQAERPVSIDEPEAADRHLLNDLLETNRRLTEDAELRLRREGAQSSEQLNLRERPQARPAAPAPADNDLLARHRKLEEDSRRMGGRTD